MLLLLLLHRLALLNLLAVMLGLVVRLVLSVCTLLLLLVVVLSMEVQVVATIIQVSDRLLLLLHPALRGHMG